jgi:protoheme IX farnesyltransferase
LLAVVARKSSITHILGIGSSCSPALIGWVAVQHAVSPVILIISLMIALWVPIHVWSVMISYRDDYLQAGVMMFPLTADIKVVAGILFVLTMLLLTSSMALYFTGYFSLFYLAVAVVLGVTALAASLKFVLNSTQASAFRVYKLSAFPFLGLLLLAMVIDQWLRF